MKEYFFQYLMDMEVVSFQIMLIYYFIHIF